MLQDPVESSKSAKGGLIRDINRHAQVVMEGMPASLPGDAADAAVTLAASAPVSFLPSKPCWDGKAVPPQYPRICAEVVLQAFVLLLPHPCTRCPQSRLRAPTESTAAIRKAHWGHGCLQAASSADRQGSAREAMDAAERPATGGSGLEDLRQQPVPTFSELRIQACRLRVLGGSNDEALRL